MELLGIPACAAKAAWKPRPAQTVSAPRRQLSGGPVTPRRSPGQRAPGPPGSHSIRASRAPTCSYLPRCTRGCPGLCAPSHAEHVSTPREVPEDTHAARQPRAPQRPDRAGPGGDHPADRRARGAHWGPSDPPVARVRARLVRRTQLGSRWRACPAPAARWRRAVSHWRHRILQVVPRRGGVPPTRPRQPAAGRADARAAAGDDAARVAQWAETILGILGRASPSGSSAFPGPLVLDAVASTCRRRARTLPVCGGRSEQQPPQFSSML